MFHLKLFMLDIYSLEVLADVDRGFSEARQCGAVESTIVITLL